MKNIATASLEIGRFDLARRFVPTDSLTRAEKRGNDRFRTAKHGFQLNLLHPEAEGFSTRWVSASLNGPQ
jgi:hypothetical protein